jgi:MoxR-like ATPase
MHRAVAGGVTAKASRDFETVTKCLAPLNGLSFVTPSIVALSVRKVYRHRLQIATVMQERSMQYGSDPTEVAKVLQGITPESVIEQVLQEVEVLL